MHASRTEFVRVVRRRLWLLKTLREPALSTDSFRLALKTHLFAAQRYDWRIRGTAWCAIQIDYYYSCKYSLRKMAVVAAQTELRMEKSGRWPCSTGNDKPQVKKSVTNDTLLLITSVYNISIIWFKTFSPLVVHSALVAVVTTNSSWRLVVFVLTCCTSLFCSCKYYDR